MPDRPQLKGDVTLPKLPYIQNHRALIKSIDFYEDGSIKHVEYDWVPIVLRHERTRVVVQRLPPRRGYTIPLWG